MWGRSSGRIFSWPKGWSSSVAASGDRAETAESLKLARQAQLTTAGFAKCDDHGHSTRSATPIADAALFEGAVIRPVAELLAASMDDRKNILVSASASSDVTLLLSLLAESITDGETTVVIDEYALVRLPPRNDLWRAARTASDSVQPWTEEVSRGLYWTAVRSRPDRLIIGDVHDGVAVDVLRSLYAGYDGVVVGILAAGSADALDRYASLVACTHDNDLPALVRQEMICGFDLVVHQNVPPGGPPITNISEVTGVDGERILLRDISPST